MLRRFPEQATHTFRSSRDFLESESVYLKSNSQLVRLSGSLVCVSVINTLALQRPFSFRQAHLGKIETGAGERWFCSTYSDPVGPAEGAEETLSRISLAMWQSRDSERSWQAYVPCAGWRFRYAFTQGCIESHHQRWSTHPKVACLQRHLSCVSENPQFRHSGPMEQLNACFHPLRERIAKE
jgi:hypothetical protein